MIRSAGTAALAFTLGIVATAMAASVLDGRTQTRRKSLGTRIGELDFLPEPEQPTVDGFERQKRPVSAILRF